MFVNVAEAADRLGYSEQTIRSRIVDKSLRAIQTTPGGAYRIPIMEIEAFKRRHGLAPRIETAIPTGVVYVNPEQVYAEKIAPVLAAHGLTSPEDVMRQVREDPSLLIEYGDFLTAYAVYVETLSRQAVTGAASKY